MNEVRVDCHRRQKEAVEKMKNFSVADFPLFKIGETVTVTVSAIDQGRLD